MIEQVLTLVASVLVLAGAVLALCASVGLARLPDTLARMHSAAKPQTLGLMLVLSGAILRNWGEPGVGILALAVVSALATSPVVANRVGELAIRDRPESVGERTPVDLDLGDPPRGEDDDSRRGERES